MFRLDRDSSVSEGVAVHWFMNMNNVSDVIRGWSNGFWLESSPGGAEPVGGWSVNMVQRQSLRWYKMDPLCFMGCINIVIQLGWCSCFFNNFTHKHTTWDHIISLTWVKSFNFFDCDDSRNTEFLDCWTDLVTAFGTSVQTLLKHSFQFPASVCHNLVCCKGSLCRQFSKHTCTRQYVSPGQGEQPLHLADFCFLC